MENIGRFVSMIINAMRTEFVVYGFTLSYWGIFLFSIIAAIIGYALRRVFW